MSGGGEGEGTTLEFTPTWVVDTVYTVVVAFSLAVARLLYYTGNNKVPLLSLEALHHLLIFIFVSTIVHVTFSVLTIVFGGAKIRQWKRWEDSIPKDNYDTQHVLKNKVTNVHQHEFIRIRFSSLV
ncbi:hypothetical protein RD792_003441 [Penstemon davidsonii]|uniref:Uncharacterized protein n=1 Tax=Penstemon davidsonii TaxID=160366 RepID=A0ABR0DUR9_9LAMI|nr:hypothetical protein RD792_003441 [Penstemon davidsonii]